MSDKIYPVKEKRDSEFCLIADQFFSWSHKSRGICSDDPLIDLKWPLDYEKVVLTDMLTTYQKRVVHNCFIKNNVFEPLFRGMKLEFFRIFFPKINFRILWHSKDFLTGRFSGHANFLGYEIKISTNSQRGIFSTLPRWSGLWIAGKSFQGIFEKLVLRTPRWWSEIWNLDLFSRRPPVFGNLFQCLPMNRVPSSKS